jgi:hypothetical protein
VQLDAGIADCADGDGEGETLQQREVDMDVEPLRLEAGEAICDCSATIWMEARVNQDEDCNHAW